MPGISASVFFSFLLSFNELPRTLYARGGIDHAALLHLDGLFVA